MLTNLEYTFLNKNVVSVHVIRPILFAITIFPSSFRSGCKGSVPAPAPLRWEVSIRSSGPQSSSGFQGLICLAWKRPQSFSSATRIRFTTVPGNSRRGSVSPGICLGHPSQEPNESPTRGTGWQVLTRVQKSQSDNWRPASGVDSGQNSLDLGASLPFTAHATFSYVVPPSPSLLICKVGQRFSHRVVWGGGGVVQKHLSTHSAAWAGLRSPPRSAELAFQLSSSRRLLNSLHVYCASAKSSWFKVFI